MGVHGIINLAKKNPSFWIISRLQDTALVIDGHCLVQFLYRYPDIDTIGNFNEYAEKVGLPLFVVFGGAYDIDDKNIEIVFGKTWERIDNPEEGMQILARITFINILDKLGIKYLKSDFEADRDIRKLDVFEIPCEPNKPFFIRTRQVIYWISHFEDVVKGKRQLENFCKGDKKEEERLFRSLEVYTETGKYTSYNLHDLIHRSNGRRFCRSPFPFGIRKWIIEHHRKGRFPNFIMNTLIHKRNILMCQLEGTYETSSHDCSLSIREVIYALLVGTETSITEYDRQKGSLSMFFRKGVISTTGVLKDLFIPDMSPAVKIKIMSTALCCPVPSRKTFRSLGGQTQLYLMITTYWTRVAEPSININFVKSVLIGYILFSVLRRELQPGAKTVRMLKKLYSEAATFAGRNNKTYKEHIPYIIYAFAQFQSCLLYASYLNSLLQCPLEHVSPALVFNGSFLHKMFYILNEMNEDIIAKHLYGSRCNVFVWFNKMLQFLQDNGYIINGE
ncbi:unnamed protein product [Mytilus coruscus]|uniref:Uncharacterized protein n=1 Tax=Mytilus coruscus TaxID=42192 RepID=A0A6J8EJ45_MYTCO|nr:unnamed protein product [Mytilus coruscus]